MKWLIACIMIAGCSPFGLNVKGYTVNNIGLEKAWETVSSYTYSGGASCFIDSPSEVSERKSGNCGDHAAMLVYLLGPDSKMLVIRNGNEYHAIVEWHGLIMEPQVYGMYYERASIDIASEWPYYKVMAWSTWFGMKSMKASEYNP